MSDGRARRKAKQARRDAARRKNRRALDPEDAAFVDELRRVLDTGNPLGLLGLASYVIQRAEPDPWAAYKRNRTKPIGLDQSIDYLIRMRTSETAALLAAIAELVDDDVLSTRCRRAASSRRKHLPPWVARLGEIHVYRAVRIAHVLGDNDQLLIGARLADGYELTCGVRLDHNMMSEVTDVVFFPESIYSVLASAKPQIDDPDLSFVDMNLADARAWVTHGIARAGPLYLLPQSDTWPEGLALLRWLIGKLPEGGQEYSAPQWDREQTYPLFRQFFMSPAGRRFDAFDYRGLLSDLCEIGTGDPLRWSATRIEQLLRSPDFDDGLVSTECLLGVPDLLRAYVPFAHAQSGIREGLTEEALTAIDECREDYERSVQQAHFGEEGDEDWAPWAAGATSA